MASDFSTPQSHAIKEGSSVLVKVGVSRVICHMDSSAATMDVMMDVMMVAG